MSPEAGSEVRGVGTRGAVVGGYVTDIDRASAVDGPGNRYVLFLQGCQFDCLVCHNSCTIPPPPRWMVPTSVDETLADIRSVEPFLSGITVTGGEATLQAPFVHALFTGLRADPVIRGLTAFVDTNGDAEAEVWELLAPVTDGVMVDLKALDDEMHVVLTGTSNTRVLASITSLAARGLLYEVRLLLVPGLNDSDEVLDRTASWLLGVDPDLRVRINAFRRDGVRPCARDLLEPRAEDLDRYRSVLSAAGIRQLTTY
ncbi:MAG: radical SAM protein [Actinomycetales bacterium]|nr:radical SAM protein [Actinomycetales bacterium]